MKHVISILFLFSFVCGQCDAQSYSAKSKIATLQLIDNVSVASRDTGIVVKVLVKPGQKVKRGQTLVRLDHKIADADVEAAKHEAAIAKIDMENKVDLEYAKKSAAVNQVILQRARDANREYENSISQTEIDQLRLESNRSELSIEQAKLMEQSRRETSALRNAMLRSAKLRRQYRDIKSPIDGQVADVIPDVGEAVSAAQPVVRVINPRRLRVFATFDSKFILKIKRNHQCRFRISDRYDLPKNQRTLKATITWISLEADPQRRQFVVHAEIDNKNGIYRSGMLGDLIISN